MIYKLRHLKYANINLDKWNKKNSKISDKALKNFLTQIENTKADES